MRRLNVLLLIISLLVVLGGGTAAGAHSDPPGLDRALAAQERHTDALLAKSGVVGTAVGLGGNGRAAVLVFLETPGVAAIPSELEGVAVVRRVTGRIDALDHKGKPHGKPKPPPPADDCSGTPDQTTTRKRPACHGYSVGHPSITAGTIGARVTDGSTFFLLSNNHVLAASNAASLGDAIIQPGTFDGGSSPADDIATLSAFKLIDFSGADNVIDAAIAEVSTTDLLNTTPSDGYGKVKNPPTLPTINMKVQKYGRTTEQTSGQIVAINAILNVNYGAAGVAKFVNQIVISPGGFSAGGDSGSIIVAKGKGRNKTVDRRPVGLLFAGSSLYTFANPINDVLSEFGVMIDDS